MINLFFYTDKIEGQEVVLCGDCADGEIEEGKELEWLADCTDRTCECQSCGIRSIGWRNS